MALRLAGWRRLKTEPRISVPGYIASSIVSSAVGRKGDPAIGGPSIFVDVRLEVVVPFDADGMGTSVFTLLRRVAILIDTVRLYSDSRQCLRELSCAGHETCQK